MKNLLMILMFGCVVLSFFTIVNTIRSNILRRKSKRKVYNTPKLSSLHGKEFYDYIDYLIRDL